ncbi:MAG: flagellar hook-basal body complex protein FliE [Rubricella sp.]
MEISSTLAARAYDTARERAQPDETTGPAPARLARDVFRTMAESEAVAMSAMAGGADSQALVEALAATELAVETAVTVRDRVVEAYQEILRMPV